jgi:hypothetical protein
MYTGIYITRKVIFPFMNACASLPISFEPTDAFS